MIVIFIPPLVTRAEDVAARDLRDAVDELERPHPRAGRVHVRRGASAEALGEGDPRIPAYAFPGGRGPRAGARGAATALAANAPSATRPSSTTSRRTEAAGVIAAALAEGPRDGWSRRRSRRCSTATGCR